MIKLTGREVKTMKKLVLKIALVSALAVAAIATVTANSDPGGGRIYSAASSTDAATVSPMMQVDPGGGR
jgi:hypothetical protein